GGLREERPVLLPGLSHHLCLLTEEDALHRGGTNVNSNGITQLLSLHPSGEDLRITDKSWLLACQYLLHVCQHNIGLVSHDISRRSGQVRRQDHISKGKEFISCRDRL